MTGLPDEEDDIGGWSPFAVPEPLASPAGSHTPQPVDSPADADQALPNGRPLTDVPAADPPAIEPLSAALIAGDGRKSGAIASFRQRGEKLLGQARQRMEKMTVPSEFSSLWRDMSSRVWPFNLSAGNLAPATASAAVSPDVGRSPSEGQATDVATEAGGVTFLGGEPEAVFDPFYQRAIDALQSLIDKAEGGSSAERLNLHDDLDDLRSLQQKLRSGRIEIVLFGEISTGKSAMINALAGREIAEVDVRGGWTTVSKAARWEEIEYRLPGIDGSEVILIDTPGINEVDGDARARIARRCAERADVILFVIDSDLNEEEYRAFLELSTLNKPLLLILNKIDQYGQKDRDTLKKVLHERLGELLPPKNLLFASANPPEREYVIEDARGKERVEIRRPTPNIADLKLRILEILEKEGLALVAVNASLFAADKADRLAAMRVRMRNLSADQVIWGFAATKALAVAINPVPLVDVMGGAAVDVAMIAALAKVYGLPMTWANAQKLAMSIGVAVSLVAVGEGAVSLGSSFFKLATFGWGTIVTALPQGAAAGFGSYLVGQTAKRYFQQAGSWGGNSPKIVVRQILADMDKESVLAQLRQRIEQRLRKNPHAT